MSGIQSEITRHAKEQENMTHNDKKNNENWNRRTQVIELVERDGKTVFKNCIPYGQETRRKSECLNRNMEDIKKTQLNLQRWKLQGLRWKIHLMLLMAD